MVVRGWDHLAHGQEGTFGVMEMLCILIVEEVTDMSAYCWQNSLNRTLKVAQLDVNYKSMKLVNQKRKET